MYALLQSKDPRLFSSAVATKASFITALALSSSAWLYSQLLGFSPGAAWAVLLSPVLLGVGTPKCKTSRRLLWLGKGQTKPPPTNDHFWGSAKQVTL